MNPNLKECSCNCFDRFIDTGEVPSGDSTYYDILKRFGFINLSNKEVREYYLKAQRFLIQKEIEGQNRNYKIQFYRGNRVLMVVFKAKAMVLEDYFTKIDAEGKHLKDILK